MIEGLIFDLDGVLVFTDEFHYEGWKKLADGLGLPFDRTKNNLLRGVSRMASLEILLGDRSQSYSQGEKEAFATEKNGYYKELLETMKPSDVPDETRCVLERLHESGIKLSVGSSSRNASFILDKVGIRKYFDAVSDGNNITKSKPDPEVFLKAAQFLELAPSVCAVVEDADSGILAAKAGGFTAIGIGDGITTASADYRIQFLAELYSLIDGINGK